MIQDPRVINRTKSIILDFSSMSTHGPYQDTRTLIRAASGMQSRGSNVRSRNSSQFIGTFSKKKKKIQRDLVKTFNFKMSHGFTAHAHVLFYLSREENCALPSSDFYGTHKCSAALRAHLSYRISPKSVIEFVKYGQKCIYAAHVTCGGHTKRSYFQRLWTSSVPNVTQIGRRAEFYSLPK